MKAGLAISTEQLLEERSPNDVRCSSSKSANVYDLQILISRIDERETRGRAANLPLPESRAGTVREVLQTLTEQARELIAETLARDEFIPWVDPPTEPESDESRFIVPLVMN